MPDEQRLSPDTDLIQIDATALFEREMCRCCDCCEGYCPDMDGISRWQHFYAFTVAGFEYLGDAKIMVRRDLLVGLPDDPTVTDLPPAVDLAWAVTPDEEPPEYAGRHTASFWDKFERAGLVCREGDGRLMVHLYAAGHHVGWTTQAKPGKGIERGHLLRVRRVASELRMSLNDAAATIRAVDESAPLDQVNRSGSTTGGEPS